ETEQHHYPRLRLRHRAAGQRKRCVERTLVSDVSADALPIGRERPGAIIAYPGLQVSRVWLRSREPKEVTSKHIDLGAEEDMIRTEGDGRGEGDVELHFLTGYWPLAARELVG